MNSAMLSDAGRSGLYALPSGDWAQLEKAAAGLAVFHVKLAGLKSKAAVLEELGRALKFPDYYGKNFDALNDCLTDFECWPATGNLIFVEGLQSLQSGDRQACATLLEILQSAAEEWRTQGKPFLVLLDTAFTGIPALKA